MRPLLSLGKLRLNRLVSEGPRTSELARQRRGSPGNRTLNLRIKSLSPTVLSGSEKPLRVLSATVPAGQQPFDFLGCTFVSELLWKITASISRQRRLLMKQAGAPVRITRPRSGTEATVNFPRGTGCVKARAPTGVGGSLPACQSARA